MAPAPQRHILRLDLGHAADQQHCLVAVSSADDADHILDLELLATTDGTKAYVLPLPHSKIARYRASKTACSESDWESALKALLLGDNPGGDVQASARIGDDPRKPIGDATGYMFIDVRKKVSGTADAALGSLKLRRSGSADASFKLFDWCAEAITSRDKLALDVGKLKREHDALKALVAEETAKIKDLARSKEEFETSHDSWLKDLLNEKKVKIRTQEQLLATAHVDPAKLAAATASMTAAGASRRSKRKADDSEADDDSNDGADKMDVDAQGGADSHDEELDDADRATTASEETASGSEHDPTPEKSGDKASRASSAAASSGKAREVGHNLRDKKVVTPDESEDEAPPRKRSPATKKKPEPAPEVDDDDVSTQSE